MESSSVQGSQTQGAVAQPSPLAASTLWAHWKPQALSQGDAEVWVRLGWDPLARRQQEGPCGSPPMFPQDDPLRLRQLIQQLLVCARGCFLVPLTLLLALRGSKTTDPIKWPAIVASRSAH